MRNLIPVVIAIAFLTSCAVTSPTAPGTNISFVTNIVVVNVTNPVATNNYTVTNSGLIKIIFTAPMSTNQNGASAGYVRVSSANFHLDSVVHWNKIATNTNGLGGWTYSTTGVTVFEGFADFLASSWFFGPTGAWPYATATNWILIQN